LKTNDTYGKSASSLQDVTSLFSIMNYRNGLLSFGLEKIIQRVSIDSKRVFKKEEKMNYLIPYMFS